MKPVFAFVSSFVLACLSSAQEPGSPPQGGDPLEAVRAAHRAILEQRGKGHEEVLELKAKVDALKSNTPERAELVKQLEAAVRRAKSPMGPFVDAFRSSDWTKFDVKTDQRLLEDGLMGVARAGTDPDKAVAACLMFLKVFPDSRNVVGIRTRFLPMALVSAGKPDEAAKALREAADASKPNAKAHILLMLGDLKAAVGDYESARAVYAEIPATKEKAPTELAAARAAVVGKAPPVLNAKTWIGGEPVDLTGLGGKVVLLGFWASWAPEARATTLKWNTQRDELMPQGLACIGVTRTYGHGYLPADPTQLDVGGTSRQGMKPEEYVEHVTTFHTNMKLHYPTAIVDDATFAAYGILPVPTVVLIGRDGKVAFVTTLMDSEILPFAMKRLLAAK